MKIDFFLALVVTLAVSLVYFIIWFTAPTFFDKIIFGGLLILFSSFWLVYGLDKIATYRLNKIYARFNWYHKMGLTESARFVEPGYIVKVWRHLFVRIPK